jgi:hypothetical protein
MNLESALFHLCPLQPGCPYCAEHATTSPESRLDWSFLDGVYCISLQSRDDQATTVVRELHRVGLCRQTFFYRPDKHPTSPTRGVWESHRVAFSRVSPIQPQPSIHFKVARLPSQLSKTAPSGTNPRWCVVLSNA